MKEENFNVVALKLEEALIRIIERALKTTLIMLVYT